MRFLLLPMLRLGVLILLTISLTSCGANNGVTPATAKTPPEPSPIKIAWAPATSQEITPIVNCVGQIQPDVGKACMVASKLPGKLLSLDVALGQHVKAGQTLARVESKEIAELQGEIVLARTQLSTAQAHEARERLVYEEELIRPHRLTAATSSYKQAQVGLELANNDFERIKKLFDSKIAAGKEFQAATAAQGKAQFEFDEASSLYKLEKKLFENKSMIRKDLDLAQAETRRCRDHLDTLKQNGLMLGITKGDLDDLLQHNKLLNKIAVVAPIDGQVSQLFSTPGEALTADKPLMEICDLSKVTITSEVPEGDVAGLRPGLPLTARVGALGGAEFEGTIASMSGRVDSDTRTLQVRTIIPNPQGKLKLNMFAEISIKGEPRQAVVCPRTAVHHDGKTAIVYIQKDGAYSRREVVLGQPADTVMEVKKGLLPGEQVVTEGGVLIKTELTYGKHD